MGGVHRIRGGSTTLIGQVLQVLGAHFRHMKGSGVMSGGIVDKKRNTYIVGNVSHSVIALLTPISCFGIILCS